jgi:flagellar M-ring protein FliF
MQLMNQVGPYALVGALLIMFTILMLRKGSNSINDSMFKGLKMNPVIPVSSVNEDDLPEIELEEKSEVKKQIDKFVKHKPAAVAQLLRNWLSDDWN